MNVLVAGATGQTGRRVVQQLVAQNIPVRGLVRDRIAAASLLPDSVELVVGDVLKPETLAAAIADCTVLICATGAKPSLDPTGPYKVDYEGTRNLVKAAKAAGIEQFVMVSSLCVSRLFHPLNLFWLVLYWKKQAELYLQGSGVPYTIIRPGGLRNEADPPGRNLVMQPADTLFEGSIARDQVARVCVEALKDDGAKNKILEIVTTTDSPDQPLPRLFTQVPVA